MELLMGVSFRLLAYFVVFYKHGFTPVDLRRAQKAAGKAPHLVGALDGLLSYTFS